VNVGSAERARRLAPCARWPCSVAGSNTIGDILRVDCGASAKSGDSRTVIEESDMRTNLADKSRRDFLAGVGIAAGGVAFAASAGPAGAKDDNPARAAAVNAMLPTPEQMQTFLALPDDRPIVMVNLLKFKPDGGEAEYARYAAGIQPILAKLGAKILFSGKAHFCLIGQADWDAVALVQYPRKKALFQMAMSPEYQAIHHHRDAGLQGQINYAVLETGPAGGQLKGVSAGDEIRPGVFRTPDERFAELADFDFTPHYQDVLGYRLHYLDEGPSDAEPILLLHGEPTWCYLYRKMIPVLSAAGFRSIAPDLIGFGRSDKPADRAVHTYKFHVDAVAAFVQALGLKNCTLFGQDWGGLIGLRVATENQDRFARVVISNTGLPTGEEPITPAFLVWKRMSQQMLESGDMPTGTLVATSARTPTLKQAYDAPFPDKRFKAGPLMMPQLVPIAPNDPATAANKRAWEVLRAWQKPFLTAFGDSDPITGGADKKFQQEVPGAKSQPHATIKGAGHFIQETHAEELARTIAKFMADNPVTK
jgi:haloalkane dehalogenase